MRYSAVAVLLVKVVACVEPPLFSLLVSQRHFNVMLTCVAVSGCPLPICHSELVSAVAARGHLR